MNTYFVFYRYTAAGRLTPGASKKRLPLLKQSVVDLGGQLIGFYLMMGRHDTVAIVQFADDETLCRFTLASTMKGYVEVETARVFDEDAYLEVISDLPANAI